jgi:hypothetical protein
MNRPGRFSVKDIVRIEAVYGEAVAGIALAVGPDRLVAEAALLPDPFNTSA